MIYDLVSVSSDNLYLLQICEPDRISLSKFSTEVGSPFSTSMEAINISSSDSEVEIEVAHTNNRSQFPASSVPTFTYRNLSPWPNPILNSQNEGEKRAGHIDTGNALLTVPVPSTTHGELPSRPQTTSSYSDSSEGEVEVVQNPSSLVPSTAYRELPSWPYSFSSNSESRGEMGVAHINEGNAFPAATVPSTSYRRVLPSWPDPSISNSRSKSKHIESKISLLHM